MKKIDLDFLPLSGKEVERILQISRTTRWKLEKEGKLIRTPSIRRCNTYTAESVYALLRPV